MDELNMQLIMRFMIQLYGGWKTEKPTEPGKYFVYSANYSFPVTIQYYGETSTDGPGFFDQTHWMGPIVYPDPPNVF